METHLSTASTIPHTDWIDRLRRGKEALQDLWARGLVGKRLIAEHAGLMDSFIREVYAHCPRPSADSMAVVALGGYGRQELFPFSDIDIMLLYPPEEETALESVAECLFYPLWDASLEVGHGVRTVEACLENAKADFFFLVSMLDARLLCGNSALFDELTSRFRQSFIQGNRKEFVLQMLAHRNERHRRFGSHVYLLEPNIKESRGGLRDLQSMIWVSRVLFNLGDLRAMEDAGLLSGKEKKALDEAWETLIQIRNKLHFISGRKNDRLFFEYQEELARKAARGYEKEKQSVETFMRHIHNQLHTIAVASDLFFEHIDDTLHLSPKGEDRHLEMGIEVVNGKIQLTDPEILPGRPYYLMKIFQHAAQEGLPIHHRTKRLISSNLSLIDQKLRSSLRMSKAFFGIFKAKHNPFPVLEAMLDTGILTAYLPEFDQVKSLVQHDVYHTYTVDQHLLQTVQELHLLRQREKKIFSAISCPHLLFLAGLLHDIGKGEGSGHAEKGAQLSEKIGKRMGLKPEEIGTLSFLVRNHLFLVDTAMRRDLEDEALILKCARKIQDLDQLDMLYLISIADSRATGPSVWTDWKAALLQELYLKIAHLLERSDLIDPDRVKAVQWMKDKITDLLGKEDRKLLDIMPEDYLLSFTPEAVVEHLRFKEKLNQKSFLLIPEDKQHYWSVLVIAKDRPGLLARIFGVLALHNLDVLAAQIFTLKDGTAVDVFEVASSLHETYREQDWDAVKHDTELALGDRLALSYRLASKQRPLCHAAPSNAYVQPSAEVVIDNETSDFYTLVEVYVKDKKGLLYDVTKTLTDFGLDIFRAKIGTKADQVVDVFYVLDRWGQKITETDLQEELKKALIYAAGCPVGMA